MVHETKFDIITLSEMLKNNTHVLEYDNVPGHKFLYRNRNKKGGCVGIYLKDYVNYEVTNDIVNIDEMLEHLWIEVQGKNKRLSKLIGIVYQNSPVNAKEIKWIEKIDLVLSSTKSTWESSIILARDMNINLTSCSTTSNSYEQMFNTYKFSCHVTKPIR